MNICKALRNNQSKTWSFLLLKKKTQHKFLGRNRGRVGKRGCNDKPPRTLQWGTVLAGKGSKGRH